MNGVASSSTIRTFGTMNVAMMTGIRAFWYLKILSIWNRKKKYHSGRGSNVESPSRRGNPTVTRCQMAIPMMPAKTRIATM